MSTTLAWHDPALPVPVEYAPEAIERIRRLAFDGLLSLPRVGLGVGGFLLGTRSATRIVITGLVSIDCAHASGPSFDPTATEINAARHLLPTEGAEIIGCYCSRPRRRIELTTKENNLFQALCPGSGLLFLLVRPSATEESRAALFYRKSDGVIVESEERPLHPTEFEADAQFALQDSPVVPTPHEPDLQPEPEPEIEIAPELLAPAPKSPVRLFGEPAPLQVPAFATAPRPTFPWRIFGAMAAAILVIAGGWSTRNQWLPKPALELHAAEIGGHFSLEWNRAAVRGLDEGQLTVTEGTNSQSIPLDRQQLEAGAFSWTRHAPEVTAVLVAGAARASARFVAPPAPITSPLPADPDQAR